METDHADGHPEEAHSTGFLPITLAVGLFIMGLFALGLVPRAGCGAPAPEAITQP